MSGPFSKLCLDHVVRGWQESKLDTCTSNHWTLVWLIILGDREVGVGMLLSEGLFLLESLCFQD